MYSYREPTAVFHGLTIDQVIGMLLTVRERALLSAPLHSSLKRPRVGMLAPAPPAETVAGEWTGLAGLLPSVPRRSEQFWRDSWGAAFERYLPRRFAMQHQQQLENSRQLQESLAQRRRQQKKTMYDLYGDASGRAVRREFGLREQRRSNSNAELPTAPALAPRQPQSQSPQFQSPRKLRLLDESFPPLRVPRGHTNPSPQPSAKKPPRPSFGVHPHKKFEPKE